MKEVVYVNEEQLFLTREEAEYSRFISVLISQAAAGTDNCSELPENPADIRCSGNTGSDTCRT